jgi:gamma-glutamylcyclotransferase (GGCT)/AIG2-like uncharacterized protein YtfP
MPRLKSFNLFVYGTLMDPSVFRAVLGKRLVLTAGDADGISAVHARPAVLDGYKKISPDNTYLYAVPDPQGRIRGYVIGPLPAESMKALRKYEGRNYSRRTVKVQTAGGEEKAFAFVGSLRQLEHSFGYAFNDPFKQEVLLREKIERALAETQREQLHTDENIARRAVAELRGDIIRDLIRRHFDAGGISDYAIRHAIKDAPLRDFARLTADPEASALAPNYLAMVVRQVMFNEIEETIRRDFRYELDRMHHGANYYERTVSSLAALRLLNENAVVLDLLMGDCLTDLPFSASRLVDFVRWGVVAADAIYESQAAKRELSLIRSHMSRGAIPLGVELEFSNIGHAVILDPQGNGLRDARYDGFLYFGDFGLDILTWKLGGHVDDHHEKASRKRRRGFFEIALGSVSIQANLSKPVTDDPWLLNQFIHEARRFFDIRPHSLHISMQLPSQHKPTRDRLLPMNVLQCLLALAGDPQIIDGRWRISRLVGDEIARGEPTPHIVFSDISRRRSSDTDDAGKSHARYVQQFKFLRLGEHINYEPIVLALKGLQLELAPGSFLTPKQYQASPEHREVYAQLLDWGRSPQPLAEADIETFLEHIHSGLRAEKKGKAAHTHAYIAWALAQLRATLRNFNHKLSAAASPVETA